MEKEELALLKKKALEQFKTGKPVVVADGAFAPIAKALLEEALEAEMEEHRSKERDQGNKRNGKGSKTVKSSSGELEIQTPQDRHSSFEPEIVKKRQRILADNLEEKIIGLYGLGTSLRDISEHIKEMYDTEISTSVLSEITERIVPKVKAWQSRPLEAVYCVASWDAMLYKVREEGKGVHKALYNVLGVNKEGRKEIIGAYISESEGANFWLGVLTDLHNRGLKDILIACVDGLKGFPDAIASIYPKTEVQSCIVHQIRNSLKYVASKNQKEFMKDLKPVYQADTKEAGETALLALADKWEKKYPVVIQ